MDFNYFNKRKNEDSDKRSNKKTFTEFEDFEKIPKFYTPHGFKRNVFDYDPNIISVERCRKCEKFPCECCEKCFYSVRYCRCKLEALLSSNK